MRWFTLRWQSVSDGCIVEHFLTKEIALRRESEVKQVSYFDQSYGVTETKVKNNIEMIEWLNKWYTYENDD